MEQSSKRFLYVIGALLITIVGMYFWKMVAVGNVEKALEVRQQQLVEQYHQTVSDNTRYFLRLTATPLVWAIRKEMLKDNYEQINDYLIQFVKNPHIKAIMVVKPDGKIAVATDKKIEGTSFESLYPITLLETIETTLENDKDGNVTLVAPIMGFDKKLGIILLVYEPENIASQVMPIANEAKQ